MYPKTTDQENKTKPKSRSPENKESGFHSNSSDSGNSSVPPLPNSMLLALNSLENRGAASGLHSVLSSASGGFNQLAISGIKSAASSASISEGDRKHGNMLLRQKQKLKQTSRLDELTGSDASDVIDKVAPPTKKDKNEEKEEEKRENINDGLYRDKIKPKIPELSDIIYRSENSFKDSGLTEQACKTIVKQIKANTENMEQYKGNKLSERIELNKRLRAVHAQTLEDEKDGKKRSYFLSFGKALTSLNGFQKFAVGGGRRSAVGKKTKMPKFRVANPFCLDGGPAFIFVNGKIDAVPDRLNLVANAGSGLKSEKNYLCLDGFNEKIFYEPLDEAEQNASAPASSASADEEAQSAAAERHRKTTGGKTKGGDPGWRYFASSMSDRAAATAENFSGMLSYENIFSYMKALMEKNKGVYKKSLDSIMEMFDQPIDADLKKFEYDPATDGELPAGGEDTLRRVFNGLVQILLIEDNRVPMNGLLPKAFIYNAREAKTADELDNVFTNTIFVGSKLVVQKNSSKIFWGKDVVRDDDGKPDKTAAEGSGDHPNSSKQYIMINVSHGTQSLKEIILPGHQTKEAGADGQPAESDAAIISWPQAELIKKYLDSLSAEAGKTSTYFDSVNQLDTAMVNELEEDFGSECENPPHIDSSPTKSRKHAAPPELLHIFDSKARPSTPPPNNSTFT